MPSTTPLTDAINALTTYANETTGQSDTDLSSAVATLVAGYGQGGGLPVIETITVNAQRSVQIDIDFTWFSTYKFVAIVPNVTASATDWLYCAKDATSSNVYSNQTTKFGTDYTAYVYGATNGKANAVWWKNPSSSGSPSSFNDITSNLYFYLYSTSKTMTGTFTIYGLF